MATLQAQREDIRRLGRKQCEDVARKSRCLAIVSVVKLGLKPCLSGML